LSELMRLMLEHQLAAEEPLENHQSFG
jgi:hypothetical protein